MVDAERCGVKKSGDGTFTPQRVTSGSVVSSKSGLQGGGDLLRAHWLSSELLVAGSGHVSVAQAQEGQGALVGAPEDEVAAERAVCDLAGGHAVHLPCLLRDNRFR